MQLSPSRASRQKTLTAQGIAGSKLHPGLEWTGPDSEVLVDRGPHVGVSKHRLEKRCVCVCSWVLVNHHEPNPVVPGTSCGSTAILRLSTGVDRWDRKNGRSIRFWILAIVTNGSTEGLVGWLSYSSLGAEGLDPFHVPEPPWSEQFPERLERKQLRYALAREVWQYGMNSLKLPSPLGEAEQNMGHSKHRPQSQQLQHGRSKQRDRSLKTGLGPDPSI